MGILPTNSMESFLCYSLGIFPLWKPGFQTQLILRPWRSSIQILKWNSESACDNSQSYFKLLVFGPEYSNYWGYKNIFYTPKDSAWGFAGARLYWIMNNLFPTIDFQWHNIGGLKSAMVGVFTTWKLANVQVKIYSLIHLFIHSLIHWKASC